LSVASGGGAGSEKVLFFCGFPQKLLTAAQCGVRLLTNRKSNADYDLDYFENAQNQRRRTKEHGQIFKGLSITRCRACDRLDECLCHGGASPFI
jgi:hypothetical protein